MTKSEALIEAVSAADLPAGKANAVRRSFSGYAGENFLPIAEILASLPDHKQYVEVLPGVPLFSAKSPVAVEIVNDYGKNVTSLFRILRTPKLLRRFCQVRRVLSDMLLDEWRLVGGYINHEPSKFWRVCAYYQLIRQLFTRGQQLQDSLWDNARERDFKVFRNTWSKSLYKWMSQVDALLPNIHGRLMRVQYEHNTWHRIFELYDDPNTLFWIDGRGDLIRACTKDNEAVLPQVLRHVKGKFAIFYWAPSDELPKSLRRWGVEDLPGESCLVVKE